MKTEHFSPKDNTIANDLEYSNLLGVCEGKGSEDRNKKREAHCDSSKGDTPLRFVKNPASLTKRDHRLYYRTSERLKTVQVEATEDELDAELNDVLNLNEPSLASRRFVAWVTKIKIPLKENWTLARLKSIREEYDQPQDGKDIEFKDFLLWYLDKAIAEKSK